MGQVQGANMKGFQTKEIQNSKFNPQILDVYNSNKVSTR
jgi:hypothetical protein